MTKLLQINNLKIEASGEFGKKLIVDNISLELNKGEVLGLIGESGAGKSTLGLASMGFARDGCKFISGEILFNGTDLTKLSVPELRNIWGNKIAYVAQSAAAAMNPAHRIIDQMAEVNLIKSHFEYPKIVQESVELFAKLQLPEPDKIGQRYPHQLSGGQLQRVMSAMAMMPRPELIIFDEPTTALDVTTQIEVLLTMKNLIESSHTAAIYITHDLAVVAQMAHRIMVLQYGKFVEEQPTESMLAQPIEEYTKTLWAVRKLAKPAIINPSQETIISINNISASYGQIRVLQDINCEFKRGQTTAVVGESGSGKSTLARVMTGLLPPTKGEIIFNGTKLNAKYNMREKSQLRHFQMIYQSADTSLNPKHRISEILGRPIEFYLGLNGKEKTQKIHDLLNMIELDPEQYMHRLPSELSGGQKQRLGIARALAAEPDFIICDEVTSALDQIVAEGILKLLSKLQRDLNLTYMFITHDIDTVRAIADNIIVMYKGEIVAQGSKDAIMNPPFHPYTEKLLSSVPQMDVNWLKNHPSNQSKP